MSAPGTAARLSSQASSVAPIRQLSSHAHMLRDVSQAPTPPGRSRRARPDAIIVPATRPASSLRGIIGLATAMETEIIVLCSRQSQVEQVARRVRQAGARGLVLRVHDDYRLPLPTFATSSPDFAAISGGRVSDLSVKRNLGLLLARLRSWRKIVFVDDDISVSWSEMARLAAQLERYQIAGMMCRDFADNSVFCHARRLAELQQDVFVTGAVLGVNCTDLPLPFFPDIYNEDWFFFADAAARHRLAKVGEARQAVYNPYAAPVRASHEEFGDLLAEGLYALLQGLHPLVGSWRPGDFAGPLAAAATEKYWSSFIEVRRSELAETRRLLLQFTERDNCSDDVPDALKSLCMADARYEDRHHPITATQCTAFLEAWCDDMAIWNQVYPHTNSLGSTRDAMDRLQIEEWIDPAEVSEWQPEATLEPMPSGMNQLPLALPHEP